jgi:hypothetical protein
MSENNQTCVLCASAALIKHHQKTPSPVDTSREETALLGAMIACAIHQIAPAMKMCASCTTHVGHAAKLVRIMAADITARMNMS